MLQLKFYIKIILLMESVVLKNKNLIHIIGKDTA